MLFYQFDADIKVVIMFVIFSTDVC